MTPKSYNKVDGGQSTARVRHLADGTNTDRDQQARLNLAARALEQPDPEEWLRDILSALGLDGHTDCPPVDTRVTAFEGVKSPGPRPATATKFPEPPPVPEPPADNLAHGKRSTFQRGCHCDLCREAQNAYMRDYGREQRAKAARRAAS